MKSALELLIILLSISIYAKELSKIDLHRRTLSHQESPTSYPLYSNAVVQTEFEELYDPMTNITLAINLWTNETGFSYSPFPHEGHDFLCDMVECTKQENLTFEFTSTWLTTTVHRIVLNETISVAGGAWRLKTSALSIDVNSISKMATVTQYGWIGLGTDSEAKKNFRDENPIFSLFINESFMGTGSLIFGFDSNIADIDKPLMVIGSDANWRMQLTSLSFGSPVHFDASQPLQVMFDLINRGIVFPRRIQESLLHKMSNYNLSCPGIICEAEDLLGLPSLIFGFADGTSFSLRPRDYMKPAVFDEDTVCLT